jgi:hypothetical protein
VVDRTLERLCWTAFLFRIMWVPKFVSAGEQ